MKKSTIVQWLEELSDLCITHIRSDSHFNYKKSYQSFVDYSEFIFSVLDYKEGSYATEIKTNEFFSLFDYVFRLNHEIAEEVCKQPEKNNDYIRGLFRFYIRFLKYAVSASDLSKIVEWQLTSYFRYRRLHNEGLTRILIETHEDMLKYLPHFLKEDRFRREGNNPDYYKAISSAYLASMRWLMRLYLEAVYHHDGAASPVFRDCILHWPQTVLRSLKEGNHFDRQGKEFLTSKDLDVDLTNKSAEELNGYFYTIVKNFRTDIILLGFIKELEYLSRANIHFPQMENELQKLWSGEGLPTPSTDTQYSPPFKNIISLFVSYIRLLFVDGSTMSDIYSRLFYQVTEQRGLMGRVHVRSVPSLQDVSLEPFIYMASSFSINQNLARNLFDYLKGLPPSILNEVSDFIPKLISKIVAVQETNAENLLKRAALFSPASVNSDVFLDNLTALTHSLAELKNLLEQNVNDALRTADIDQSKLEKIVEYASYKLLSPEHTGIGLGLFRKVGTMRSSGIKESFLVRGWPKRELLHDDNNLRISMAGADGYFAEVGSTCLYNLVYRNVLSPTMTAAHKILAPSSDAYWDAIKSIIKNEKDGSYFLLLDNRTRPRWVYDWCDEYGGLRHHERPKDFNLTQVKRYKDQNGYIGTVNDRIHIIYISGVLDKGQSLLFPLSNLEKLSLREMGKIEGQQRFFSLELLDREDEPDRVDIKLTCEHKIDFSLTDEAYLIAYQDSENNNEEDDEEE